MSDTLEFFEELAPAAPGRERSTNTDRYRDFRAVFEDDRGRRVLWQIFEEMRMFGTPIIPGDTHLTYARIGKQEIGRWLLLVLTKEPGDSQPKQTDNEEPDD